MGRYSTRIVLHLSAPLAPSAPFEIARDPIDQPTLYFRRRPKRNKRLHLVGLIDICLYLYIFVYIYICIHLFIYLHDLVYI